MSHRKQVVQVECSRCERVEHREGSAEKPPHVFLAKLFADASGQSDLEVKFEDLCSPCQRAVRSLLEGIGKQIKGVSPDRKETKPAAAPPAAPPAKKEGPTPNGAAPPAHPAAAASKNPAAARSS